ncbi:MAG: dual specificity protein phosphatase family protein [Blastocatellales bacterium]
MNKASVSSINRFDRIFAATLICAVAMTLVAASVAISKDKGHRNRSGEAEHVDVENFGKVTDFFYRGAQPRQDEYEQLAEIGIKTIIDLRNDPKDFARSSAEKNGMHYINMPMSDKDYPEKDAASRFLKIVNDSRNWPVFVHCAGGRHRTGVMTAVYRMTNEGWDIERAYDEMKDYDFYTRWGHKAMKQYVYDYYDHLTTRRRDSRVATRD